MARQARSGLALVTIATLLAGCQSGGGQPGEIAGTASPPAIDLDKGRSDPVADPLYPEYGNPALDILHYDLALSWAPTTRRLAGEAVVTLRTTKRVDALVLDFSSRLKVSRVTVAGGRVRAEQRKRDLVVTLPEPIPAERRLTLAVRYAGTPRAVRMPSTRGDYDEGLGLRAEPDGAIWTMQEPYGAFTWYPVNDHPSDEALYDIAVTVPDGWSGVASGQFLGAKDVGPDTRFRWRSADPVGSYVTTLAVDRFTRYADQMGDVPLTYWVPEEYDGYQLRAMRRTPEILRWLAKRFGPYPFSSAGAVAVDSSSAMETQAMVTMGGTIADADLDSDEAEAVFTEVLVHEYAHQWFGDAVSPRDWRAVWLNEGFATYVEMLWTLEAGDSTQREYLDWLRTRDRRSREEAGPPGRYDPGMFAESNVYVGPALMLHEIREKIGDRTFFRMVRDWVQRQRHTHQDRASFTRFVTDYGGDELKPIIDAWLDSPTTPS
ncbi:MAG: M1 family metallopeptidase [Micromonosporaceae bacterium]